MINQNGRLTSVDILAHRFSIEISDPELSKLNYKYGGVVNVKISKPVSPGSEEQNRAAHSLMGALFDTGMHSSPALTPGEFKLWCKIQFGPCMDWQYEGHPVKVPKSWADYAKQERAEFITRLLDYIDRIGAMADRKIQEILAGMDENTKLKYG